MQKLVIELVKWTTESSVGKMDTYPGGSGSSGPTGAAAGAAVVGAGAGVVVSVFGTAAAVPFGVLDGVC